MALIFENSKEFQDNEYTIPKDVGQVLNAYDKSFETQDPHFAMTIHRVVHRLADNGERYNEKKGKNGEKQQAATLTANDAKRIKGTIKRAQANLDSPKNAIIKTIGTQLEDICDDALGDAKRKSQRVKPTEPPKPTEKTSTKPAEVKMETTPNGVKYQLAAHKTPRKVMDESKKIYISEAQVLKLKGK